MVIWSGVTSRTPAQQRSRGTSATAGISSGAGPCRLGTIESELNPDLRDILNAARPEDAVITYGYTGKPCRALRSKFTDAWVAAAAPPPQLGVPYQSILSGEPFRRAERAHRKDWMAYATGQVVGQVNEPKSVREVMYDMLGEYIDAAERIVRIIFRWRSRIIDPRLK